MRTAITILTLVCLAALLISGCAGNKNIPLNGGTDNAQNSIITGDIKEVDSLSNDLNDSELENTEAQLNEINW